MLQYKKYKHIFYNIPLPDEIITNILLYDSKYIIREGLFIIINKLNKNDIRYKILKDKRPLIFIGKTKNDLSNNSITIYNNILEKDIYNQYKYIYDSIQIHKHF